MEGTTDEQRKNMVDNESNNATDDTQSASTSTQASALAIASTSRNDEPSPKMFKLNVDCFEHLFEWLSLEDLLVLRRTCKRIKAVVDYYIKLNYPQLFRLRVHENERLLALCDTRLNYFEWIKHLELSVGLSSSQIESIKYVLNQLETLGLDIRSYEDDDGDVAIGGDLYEVLLKHCPRLKHLSVTTYTSSTTLIGSGNEWLLRVYPTLEHLDIKIGSPFQHSQPIPCPELLTFFHQNPNVRTFSTDGFFLLMNRDIFRGSNIRLDHFKIRIIRNLPEIRNLMNNLHHQGLYQHLHLVVCRTRWITDNELQHLWTIPNVYKLELRSLMGDFPIPIVESIQELGFERMWFPFTNIPYMMALSLMNLKRVDFIIASLRHVSPFICFSPKLKEIRIWRSLVEEYDDFYPDISDFIALNEARKKLPRPQKVTIFVDENLFLELKMMGTVDFELIELKRIDSCEQDRFHD